MIDRKIMRYFKTRLQYRIDHSSVGEFTEVKNRQYLEFTIYNTGVFGKCLNMEVVNLQFSQTQTKGYQQRKDHK